MEKWIESIDYIQNGQIILEQLRTKMTLLNILLENSKEVYLQIARSTTKEPEELSTVIGKAEILAATILDSVLDLQAEFSNTDQELEAFKVVLDGLVPEIKEPA